MKSRDMPCKCIRLLSTTNIHNILLYFFYVHAFNKVQYPTIVFHPVAMTCTDAPWLYNLESRGTFQESGGEDRLFYNNVVAWFVCDSRFAFDIDGRQKLHYNVNRYFK